MQREIHAIWLKAPLGQRHWFAAVKGSHETVFRRSHPVKDGGGAPE